MAITSTSHHTHTARPPETQTTSHTKTTVTLTTTTTSVQRDTRHHSPAADWETNQVSHHIPHVHERRAIGSFFNEHGRTKVTSKNHDKKHYHQKIVNHTNNNLIVNLTNQKLEPPLKSMLTKGLKFIPTPDNTRLKTILNSFKQFRRSMYIHYHFRNSSNDHPNPFKTTSTWEPPLPDNPNLLSYICSVAESINHTFRHNSHDQHTSNLNEEETNFLATYNIHNRKYVIKPADKGGAIVIWSTTDYEKEALSQLNDNKYYEYVQANSTTVISTQPQKSLSMSKIFSNLETLTTKHCNIYYHPHHHIHPFSISYPKFTNLETQVDQSYQGVIHQQIGYLHSSIPISNHSAVHYHPTSKTQIISYKPFSISTHHYHPTPL